MQEIVQSIVDYLINIDWLEASGLLFGLLAVYYLIKESIYTWPAGIIYVLISFVIFWRLQLYGDFLLHIIFLILNIYGWYYWAFGKQDRKDHVPITWLSMNRHMVFGILSLVGIIVFGYMLSHVHEVFTNLEPASVPYWDAATTSLSITGMWLTARKKVDNWMYWLAVDILATGIYIYKGIYFYALLYFIYIGLAVIGFREWKKLATS